MVVHSQNTSFTYTAMMCTGWLVVRTLLAVSQIPTLALDLVDGVVGVLDVGRKGVGDPARILVDGGSVIEGTHESEGGENDGVHDPGRGPESEPLVHKHEHRRDVYVADRRNHNGDG